MPGHRVSIESDWDAMDFHCPACGSAVVQQREETRVVEPCAHLRYFWISMVGSFEWLAADIDAARLEALAEDDDADDLAAEEGRAPDDWDAADLCSDSTVVFCFDQTGPGCGPAPYTVEIAIDFNGTVTSTPPPAG